MTRQAKITALYERLSQDDDRVGESGSILNQKTMLEAYAAQHGFCNVVHFTDDGFSGKDFDRPGWQAMIAEIEAGNVTAVIVKDMFRVGRDYLQTGFYTEVFFREKGVRFIAVANGIDSQNSESVEFAPFLNIMSEWHLKNTSRSIKAAKKTQGMAGKRLTTFPIYGYRHDSNDREKWIIDPVAADVVRRLYQLVIAGHGTHSIARILVSEKILSPVYHRQFHGIAKYAKDHSQNPYAWSAAAVADIIARPEYMGHTVNFRFTKESYKDKKSKRNPKEDWIIFEGTHPEIVDPQTWETAQKCRQTIRRPNRTTGQANPFTGLVFCADCGKKLYNHRKPAREHVSEEGKTYRRKGGSIYRCSTFNLAKTKFKEECSSHHINDTVLQALTLETIQSVSSFVKEREAEFVQKIREDSVIRGAETEKAHRKRIAREERRIGELDALIRRIYEDNVAGKLTDKRFAALSQEYEREQAELEQSIIRLNAELATFQADNNRVDKFLDLVKRYTDFSELTPTMIAEFVEKIIVHEADKSIGEREQEVEIYLNFIGRFDVPILELTPEEMEAEELARCKRTRHREAQRRYLAKQEQKSA